MSIGANELAFLNVNKLKQILSSNFDSMSDMWSCNATGSGYVCHGFLKPLAWHESDGVSHLFFAAPAMQPAKQASPLALAVVCL